MALFSIEKSMMTYRSEILCWKNFIEMMDTKEFLNPSQETVMAYVALFRNANSCEKYLTALRWAHTKLRLANTWYTDSIKQCIRGARKLQRHSLPVTNKEFVYAD